MLSAHGCQIRNNTSEPTIFVNLPWKPLSVIHHTIHQSPKEKFSDISAAPVLNQEFGIAENGAIAKSLSLSSML